MEFGFCCVLERKYEEKEGGGRIVWRKCAALKWKAWNEERKEEEEIQKHFVVNDKC